MTSATPWRRHQSPSNARATSPARPIGDDIERLSPGPGLTPRSSKRYTSQREEPLFGLGLSSPSGLNGTSSIAQPDHIYIDQHGGAHIGGRPRVGARHPYTSDTHSRNGRATEAQSKRASTKTRSKAHTRSGSTIDDLANIAIATSPTFDDPSPTFPPFSSSSSTLGVSRPATSYIDSYNNDDRLHDRPAKRVRSEKLHQMEWSPRDGRPRTSHVFQQQTSMEEVELLLGLRTGFSFSTNTSPVCQPATTYNPPSLSELIQLPVAEGSPVPKPTKLINDDDIRVDKPEPSDVNKAPISSPKEVSQFSDPMLLSSPIEELINQPVLQAGSPANVQPTSVSTEQPQDDLESLESNVLPVLQVSRPATSAKKPRKIKPEVQAEVCAACQKLQREPNDENVTTQWICCDYCSKWFHLACGGFKDKAETRAVDKFVCKDCEPQHGQTTFVRKSSRVRTAIDYAGLNQGVVKSSEESSMHHYIQPIKDGVIKYLPDDFARIRPEILTAEFWENMDNMKRPFVVPACWNPRFGHSADADAQAQEALDAEPLTEPSFITYDSSGKIIQQAPAPDAVSHDKHTEQPVTEELAMECDQDYLDMVMPRHLTVRKVAELYGPEQPVPVIDVKSQETKGQWTLNDWADYYEQQGEKAIRNVISLEVSNSPIGKLIRRPKAVRDIDLEDYVWDNDTRTSSNKRPVQFYCLMSVADSYTDFHIDFGGSSVYYHILKGVKTFFFIPPEEKNLKEYEKWCNSDAQNDTWLGDLCNGNVTRVDLHEGDTAFIPAGWIHSVWTPEDSLVIGGNFLTRLDYELQLRVANIEKATKVPQKFRYPFFQKVMWYALLKYLEEDPVPEEVLKDFHADEDYCYLRANPVWHEYDGLASEAEPGEPGYNARIYPKSEIHGLPYLRDYLYRTACIHADIPVPDVNKKQIDAVKASIPKGHGDPMRLIKTFAVWCAWKTGNEAVPRWVHDQGDGLMSELKERERAKEKEEAFRVPPERVSARNASKAKASSPVVEAVSTPAKATANIDANDNSSVKSRSGSRGGSLRVACEACRKRRIKCRHKEGDDSTANSSPPAIRPRTYSNVSVDIPKLASASPVSSALDQGSTTHGVLPDFSNTSDLAQAALATLHSQSSDSPQNVTITTPNGGSAKKGRSKACEECRKSKRRCVHDEYGRIDPAKAAEPSKPRGSASGKRHSRASDESVAKRQKTEPDIDPLLLDTVASSDIDMLIDPALMADGFSFTAIHAPTESIVTKDPITDHLGVVPPLPTLAQDDTVTSMDDGLTALPASASRSPTTEDAIHTNLPVPAADNAQGGLTTLSSRLRASPEVDNSYSPITVDGMVNESTEKPDVKLENGGDSGHLRSRHSSRQPKQVDCYIPGKDRSPSKAGSKPVKDRQTSSSSEHTIGTDAKSRRSSSNTSGTTHHMAATDAKQRPSLDTSVRPVSRASSVGSDIDADEKLARELQAAENGLRRRASMRA